ncbi:olfactory receptor 5AP2-like [Anomaloglossus baeobatrachus]|uniref:olfactory receptor 5AP2-like n=1 Tax=Anomaloglossus baeobatrachus TaxID=238106 RepID=UPI003F4F8A1B
MGAEPLEYPNDIPPIGGKIGRENEDVIQPLDSNCITSFPGKPLVGTLCMNIVFSTGPELYSSGVPITNEAEIYNDLKKRNLTRINEFLLSGLSDVLEIQRLLFVLFFCIYVITVFANVFIIFVIQFSSNLKTPMYFFLANFSFLEICYVTSTVPKMLSNFLATRKTISFYGCVMQMYWFLLLGGAECYMLAAMAYDRYHAICHPLQYCAFLSRRVCIQLISGSWVIGAVNALIHTVLTFTMPFCLNKIDHFFCDIPPLLKLACIDTWFNEVVIFVISGSVIVGSFILTMISYVKIISTIVNMKSNTSRVKAFSTCVSHFTVVIIFFGSGIFMYFRPKSSYAMDQDRLVALMYTIIAPLLNPFIYTFRNGNVKVAINRLIHQMVSTPKY